MAGGGKGTGEQRYTTGRAASAVYFGPYHSAVAAKKGKKLRATGRVLGEGLGGSVAGGVAGALGGAALSRGNAAATQAGNLAGSTAGGVGGTYHAFRANNKKGRYKQQSPDKFKKNSTISAFGIEH
jgi:hypothetical protein